MTCLCEYMTPQRAVAAGLSPRYFEGKVCTECARKKIALKPKIRTYYTEPAVCTECNRRFAWSPPYCVPCRLRLGKEAKLTA